MTNYEKKLKEMTVDQMASFINASDECIGAHVDEGFSCQAPEDMSCVQCIKNWLVQEAEQD
ncbi:hypothetical protein DSECCO2_542110 [anaerobic digester metagenome]